MSDTRPLRDSRRVAPDWVRAHESLWRLGALALAHPTPEFHAALQGGAFQAALAEAWDEAGMGTLPAAVTEGDFAAFEAGYIAAFLHGQGGKPVASLLAGDHEALLAGVSRPVFMLNIAGFYRHFGLQPARADEGRADEPDHLVTMMEFMAVLSHLESRALQAGRDPAPLRRAQRDFLARHLAPFLETIAEALHRPVSPGLDHSQSLILAGYTTWARTLLARLEQQVGPYRDRAAAAAHRGEPAEQDLWG